MAQLKAQGKISQNIFSFYLSSNQSTGSTLVRVHCSTALCGARQLSTK